MKNEQKQKVEYVDQKLEAATEEALEEIENQRMQDIKSGTLQTQMISGELVLKIMNGQNFASIPGKNKFAF